MGSTANPPPASVSLAPFAFDWVGGDIHGLQMLAIQLHGYVPATTDVTTALDRRAGQLTSDDPGGWQGSAASAFAASWSRDALAGGALAAVIGQVSEITGGLAVALSEIENALETQADTAARHGVQIMPDGQPGPQPEGPPASTAEAAQQQWAASYQQVWQRARAEAGQVRQQAAAQLAGIYQQIAPPHKRSPGGISASEDITVSELLTQGRRGVHQQQGGLPRQMLGL
jgi:hypothetical protein